MQFVFQIHYKFSKHFYYKQTFRDKGSGNTDGGKIMSLTIFAPKKCSYKYKQTINGSIPLIHTFYSLKINIVNEFYI